MASEQVITALESLHRELDKLKPAVESIETAKSIVDQITQAVKTIPQKHLDLLKEVKASDVKHKTELTNLFTKELTELTGENKKLSETTAKVQQQIREEQESQVKLQVAIDIFHKKVEQTNFPEKFEQLDFSVGKAIKTVQDLHDKINDVEKFIDNQQKEVVAVLSDFRQLDASVVNATKTVNGLGLKIDDQGNCIEIQQKEIVSLLLDFPEKFEQLKVNATKNAQNFSSKISEVSEHIEIQQKEIVSLLPNLELLVENVVNSTKTVQSLHLKIEELEKRIANQQKEMYVALCKNAEKNKNTLQEDIKQVVVDSVERTNLVMLKSLERKYKFYSFVTWTGILTSIAISLWTKFA
jgi:chromosome segregation ATPase